MFCTNCGKQLVDGAYACPYCGNVVDSAVKSAPAEKPEQVAENTVPAAEAAPAAPAPQPTYNPYTQPQYQAPAEPEKPVRTHPLTIVGFICAFAAPLAGLIISLIAKSKMKRDPSIAGGRGMNKAGIILSIIGIVMTTILTFVYILLIGILIASGENVDFEFYMSLLNLL